MLNGSLALCECVFLFCVALYPTKTGLCYPVLINRETSRLIAMLGKTHQKQKLRVSKRVSLCRYRTFQKMRIGNTDENKTLLKRH